MTFPATMLAQLREAAASPDTTIPLASSPDIIDIQILAERWRYFRWCIRAKFAIKDLTDICNTYDLRTTIRRDEVGYILYLIAKPTKVSEFVRLNPDLAGEILPQCQ